MKKRQLSLKKIANDADKSQTKISSFFTRIKKSDLSNNETVSSASLSSENPIDRKRKERDETSNEEDANIKRKCTLSNHILKDHCTTNIAENGKSSEDSALSLKNSVNTRTNCKENKIKSKQSDASPQKVATRERNVASPGKAEQNTKLQQSTAKTENVNTPEVAQNTNHVLKESQDANTVALRSSAAAEMIDHKGTKLLELEKELVASDERSEITDRNEFDNFFDDEWHGQIDFTTLQRCKVIDVMHEARVTTLRVQHTESESIGTIACSGFWQDVRVRTDDVIMVQAKKESQQWLVDNNNGLLVTQPDMLISGTTITSGLFCNRRAVLAEKFRKIESLPSQNGDYSVMTVGSLVHQWLQKALRENVHALSDVIKLLDDLLRSRDTIDYLYASELTLADCRKRMMEYAPRIFEFIQHYVNGNRQQHINGLKDNFRGSICNVQDIEENVYIPKLGIKGRIDVTAEVNISSSRRKIMPLEVKTGRASYSLEHKGQVILYLMMMGFRDREVDTGLLLYLKENAMQEIKGNHHEKRDLILLRNTLAHYFATRPSEDLPSTSTDLKAMELPGPINHHSACLKCPYRALCCAHLTRDPDVNLSPSHSLTPLVKELLDSVESSHLDYIMRWVALLHLEESHESKSNSLSNVWTMSPEKREARGTCICNLKILGKVVEQEDKYRHTFARVNVKGDTIESGVISSALNENDYVIISTDARINIAAGCITHVSHDVVAVLLDKDITRQEKDSIFHIDKYSSTGLSTFNYANVAGLLNDDEISMKLRRVVIDRRPATFVKKLPRSIISTGARIISDLNEDQQRAVLKAVAADDYILIKGMPGTGKTQMLVALIELLQELGSSVLITAHTHSAVDNVLLKLLERNVDFLRLGSTRQIHPLLTCKSEEYAIASCDSPESLETLYNGKRIVGVTCYGAYHALLRRRTFDVCLVDESAQIMQPTVLRPLYSARKFVLVGDPDQLPPVVRSRTAVRLGADESLFVRLDTDSNTVNLSRQYRMNGRIMKLANDVTYRDKLIPGNRQVENATLTGENMERTLSSCEKWIRIALSRNLEDSVVVLDTGSTYNLSMEPRDEKTKSDQVYFNIWEAGIVSRLVQVLKEAGVHARNVGVIAPYNAQINFLKKIIDKEVEVNTVDQYQGRDKDVILYSCTKSVEHDAKKEFEILDDQRRLTVAITRARHKLIVIADKVTLTRYTPFRNLFDVIDERNAISLRDGEEDFHWKNLIREIDNISHEKEFKKEC